MKFFTFFLLPVFLYASHNQPYKADVVPKKMTVDVKKDRFYYLIKPTVLKVYKNLLKQYETVKEDIKYHRNPQKIKRLMKEYYAKDEQDLLKRLYPHPPSITLAQAAVESGWATSRFFREANNLFGMWSNKKTEPRIETPARRKGKKVWLRRFDSIEESVKEYYEILAKNRAFRRFRDIRYQNKNVYKVIKALDRYSERRQRYIRTLHSVIKYNKLTKYD